MKTAAPIVGLLHNAVTQRWYPVVFDCQPVLDSGRPKERPPKSVGHHAVGFATRHQAVEAARHVANVLVSAGCASACQIDVAADIEWDGVSPVPPP